MFRRWLGPNERETVATQVTMEDGTESPLVDHMRDAHQKGTSGFTEDYLDGLHRNLHQRKREPEEELEHRHPGAAGEDARGEDARGAGDHAYSGEQHSSGALDSRQRDSGVPRTSEAATGSTRDQRERVTPEAMNAKHRDREEQGMSGTMKTKNRNGQRNPEADNGQHRDRYQQNTPEVPDQRTSEPQAQGMQGMMPEAANGESRDREDQMASAGGQRRNGNGKHRKQRH
jgi:hypothetical protein